ncbi:sulfite exporter TauE/SafE family protein [Aeromonas simiae]|uniref:sulfite exporter TauE/SafE family protein n=1 Tax=Aeromonas simiae TaxID=218936 RepID=UPI00266D2ABB|nr:sulfite exporter TauE/SafE family protein [Aeromonas simiae]MDO2951474.1 sulfite exporter TauE/SafE family protein [Aeromonas simiae]
MTGANLDLLGALLMGLAASSHCFAMCGGVSAALSMAIPAPHQRFTPRLAYLLCYNVGRIASYVLAGALAGGLLASLAELGQSRHALVGLQLVAALMMMAVGLYLAGWWQGVLAIERLGARLWPLIRPLANRCLPLRTPLAALPFGMVWGWLPCGMVYSMLTWSAAAGSAGQGALVMLSFGIGTLPTLFALGGLADRLRYWLAQRSLRLGSAILLILFGLHALWVGIRLL